MQRMFAGRGLRRRIAENRDRLYAVALAWSFGFPQLRQIQSLDRDAEESRAALKAGLDQPEKSGPGTA